MLFSSVDVIEVWGSNVALLARKVAVAYRIASFTKCYEGGSLVVVWALFWLQTKLPDKTVDLTIRFTNWHFRTRDFLRYVLACVNPLFHQRTFACVCSRTSLVRWPHITSWGHRRTLCFTFLPFNLTKLIRWCHYEKLQGSWMNLLSDVYFLLMFLCIYNVLYWRLKLNTIQYSAQRLTPNASLMRQINWNTSSMHNLV